MPQHLERPFTSFVLALMALLFTTARLTMDAAAVEWQPSGPLMLVCPSAAGSSADAFTRIVAETITRERLLPVPVEVLNKSGGSGAIAINFLAQKKGDAAYLLAPNNFIFTTPLRQKDLPSYRNFQPVAVMAHDTNAIYVLASSPYRTIKDLIEAARRRPGSVMQGLGVIGGTNHIISYQLGKATGVEFSIVVFKGGTEATLQLLGGRIDFTTDNPNETRAYVQAGKLRVLAVVGDRRLRVFPGVPTLKELGIHLGSTFAGFRGFIAPAGTSKEAIDAYALLIRKVMNTTAWRRYVLENELAEEYLGPSEMATFMERQNDGLARVLAEVVRLKK